MRYVSHISKVVGCAALAVAFSSAAYADYSATTTLPTNTAGAAYKPVPKRNKVNGVYVCNISMGVEVAEGDTSDENCTVYQMGTVTMDEAAAGGPHFCFRGNVEAVGSGPVCAIAQSFGEAGANGDFTGIWDQNPDGTFIWQSKSLGGTFDSSGMFYSENKGDEFLVHCTDRAGHSSGGKTNQTPCIVDCLRINKKVPGPCPEAVPAVLPLK